MQQPATVACVHVWVVSEHVSDVQALPSPQSASVRQQAAMVALLHEPLARQASTVHGSPSLQSPATVQHAGLGVCTQVFDVPSQVSVVHAEVSAHWPSLRQQFAIAGCAQVWDARSQTSRVQAAPSSHCASLVQQPGRRTFEQAWSAGQMSTVQMSPSLQSPFC